MTDPLQKLFSTLSRVRPDAEFAARTRAFLVSAGSAARPSPSFRRKFFEDITFGMALVCASVVLVFAVFLYASAGMGVTSLARQAVDAKSVLEESQTLTFDIELGEASYFEDSAVAVAAVLNQIEKSAPENRAHGYR